VEDFPHVSGHCVVTRRVGELLGEEGEDRQACWEEGPVAGLSGEERLALKQRLLDFAEVIHSAGVAHGNLMRAISYDPTLGTIGVSCWSKAHTGAQASSRNSDVFTIRHILINVWYLGVHRIVDLNF
jgi:hypothetical protein